ncbi:MAG: transglycosylase domain-containing protein, partial [Pseudomonadota bacterium]|nr:transglycosylase domain-containing protein [Pseudomonadota bacterium]
MAASAALLLDRLLPPDLSRAGDVSALVLDGRGGLLRGFAAADDAWRLPLAPQDVDPLFLAMLKGYEDRRFDRHPGVDPLAVLRAAGQWLRHGRVVSGASTLTMQAARLLEPRPRTLGGKLLEMLRALQLERRYDKDMILALYLTLAPYGGNLYGLRAASLAYLGKEPRRLTPAEAALLVALPQSPSRLRPDRYPERARAARDKVLERMERLGILTPRQAAEAREEPVARVRRPLPFHAPHLA